MPIFRPELTEGVIGAFYAVYDRLRFGYLESVYSGAMERELQVRGIPVAREVPVDVWYRDRIVGRHRVDLLVNDAVIVEIKSGRLPDPNAEQQVLNYLRATDLEVGLLLYFGPKPMFRRFVCTNRPMRSSQAGPTFDVTDHRFGS